MLLIALTATPCFSSALVLTGIFSQDNQVQLFTFNISSISTVTVKTYSYGGGQVGPNVIPSGGFSPSAFFFDNVGNVITANSGSCSQVQPDSVTGNCDDIFFQNSLDPGSYTFALAVDDNRPLGNFVSDGFFDDSNPGFTCAGAGGAFCDLTDSVNNTPRTGAWAISFLGTGFVNEVETPEPGSLILLSAGFGLIALSRRRLLKQ